jgi:site-specific DNA recombinase
MRIQVAGSAGPIGMHVLLSFAQFEREVTSERIRDKIAASKRKGLWVGGMAPLGYDTRERKITVNKAEAETVRTIFRSYLKLGGLNPLMTDLRKHGIVTKKRLLKSGKAVGAIAFTRGPLAHLLRNRFYIGEVVFKGERLPGEQPAIIDRKLFDAVQAKLDGQLRRYKQKRTSSGAILAGRLFDDRGQRMTPTHTRKGATKYRYYVSRALVQGQSEEAGSISRISAPEIEARVTKSVRDQLGLSVDLDDKALVQNHVTRVDLRPGRLVVELVKMKGTKAKQRPSSQRLEVPWRKTSSTRQREILLPEAPSSHPTRPIRSENRALLIASISKGRRWLSELITEPAITVDAIAQRENCSVRKVNMTISLAFLAPDLIKAAIEGRLPYGMGVTRLCELPPEWSRQYRVLGLTTP